MLSNLSNRELVQEINRSDIWEPDLLQELMQRANMLDAWNAADGENFEEVIRAAANKLGIIINGV